MKLPAAAEITAFHDYALAAPGQPARFESGLWEAIEANIGTTAFSGSRKTSRAGARF